MLCVGDILSFCRVHIVQVPICLNQQSFRERWRPKRWVPRFDIYARPDYRNYHGAEVFESEHGMHIRTASVTNVSDWSGQFLDAAQARAAVAPGDTIRVMVKQRGDRLCRYCEILAVDAVDSEWLYVQADSVYRQDADLFPPGVVARIHRGGISEVPLMFNRPELSNEIRRLDHGVSVTGGTFADPEERLCQPPTGNDDWFDPTLWLFPPP